MQIYDIIAGAQGGQAVTNLAHQLGISEAETKAAIEAAMPELIAGIERNTLSRGGLADLVAALGQGHHEQILERPDVYADPRVQKDGQGILGHILGSDSRARGLSVQTARSTGISDSIIQMLLPILAQMLMGALSKWLKGGLGDIASKIPGGGGSGGGGLPFPIPQGGSRQPSERQGGGYGGGFELPKVEAPRGGFPMPPMPGGGSDDGGFRRGGTMEQLPAPNTPSQGGFPMPWPKSDGGSSGGIELPGGWPNQGGGAQRPLPVPQTGQGDNPLGDLSDILRRGGGNVGSPRGNGIGGSVRDIIGSGLGFQSKGVIGWLVRLLIMRFGWGLLKRMLGRAFGGR